MRKAAEAVDDLLVRFGLFHEFGVGQRCHQGYAAALRRDVLAVFKRQIKKQPRPGTDLRIEAFGNRRLGEAERRRVAGVGLRRATKDVARELIEHNHRRKRRLGIRQTGLKREAFDRCMRLQEAPAQVLVKGCILTEPAFGCGRLQPEAQHILDPAVKSHAGRVPRGRRAHGPNSSSRARPANYFVLPAAWPDLALAPGAASSMVRTTLDVGRSGPTAAPLTSPFTTSSQRATVASAVLALVCTTL